MIRTAIRAPCLALAVICIAVAGCGGAQPSTEPPSAARSVPPPDAPTASPTPSATPSPTPVALQGLDLDVVDEGFAQPVDVEPRPNDGKLFVAEQPGVIRAADGSTGEHSVMLDISDVVNSASIEQGLLGFAFHPDYPDDPRVFVFHSRDDNDNVLASYETAGDPDVLDPSTRLELLVIDKEADRQRHNGGTVLFGPDGMLYLSVGDGELGVANAQNRATRLGKILRLDVDASDAGSPYAIPSDNPYATGGGAPEIWWHGLRNPWRFSVDVETGLAYVADVGQEYAEEVSVVPLSEPGVNFGWPNREGLEPFNGTPLLGEATDPVIEIVHDDVDGGCSVTGGEVYRGPAIPELVGHYFYADWCNGWIRSFRFEDGAATDPQDWSGDLEPGSVSSFGHDADGELLVVGWDAGTISRIVPRR